jgi:hypothetical protein
MLHWENQRMEFLRSTGVIRARASTNAHKPAKAEHDCVTELLNGEGLF